MNGCARDRGAQPRRRARMARAQADAGADAREGEREVVERDREGRDRAAVDAARRVRSRSKPVAPAAPR